MADIRIKDLTTEDSTSRTGDFLPIDGGTGTRKLSAYSPTFGGNLTVSGNTTVAGQLTVSNGANIALGDGLSLQTAGSASIRYQDAGVSKWWIYKLSGDQNLYFRDMVNARMQMIMQPGATSSAALTTLYSGVAIDSTTASLNSSSGALVVGGGLGVVGAINAGATITTTEFGYAGGLSSNSLNFTRNSFNYVNLSGGSSASMNFNATTTTPNDTPVFSYNNTRVAILTGTTSSNTASGALQVTGGVGVSGAINAGSSISSWTGTFVARSASANPSFYAWTEQTVADRGVLGFEAASSTLKYRAGGYSMSTGTEVFSITSAGNTTAGGTLTATRQITSTDTSQANDTSQAYFQAIAGNDATLGGLVVTLGARPSATGANRYAFIGSGDNGAMRPLSLCDNGSGAYGQVLVRSSSASTGTSSGALVVSGGVGVAGNVSSGGQVAATGTGTSGPYIASSAVIDYDSSTARFYGRGPNTSTRPSLGFYSTYSDGAGGLTLMTFNASGAATIASSLTTGAPSGGTAAAWKLGTVATVSPTSPNRTIEVDIGGTIYYIHAKTTNN